MTFPYNLGDTVHIDGHDATVIGIHTGGHRLFVTFTDDHGRKRNQWVNVSDLQEKKPA